MNRKIDTFRAIQNDYWIATTLGTVFFSAVITFISVISNRFILADSLNTNVLAAGTGVFALISIILIPLRIRYIQGIFDNGVEVKAAIKSHSIYKANLKLNLEFEYLGQVHNQRLEQVITRNTKHFIDAKEVVLVIDPNNLNRLLLRDVYIS
jgi:hypothetical protein